MSIDISKQVWDNSRHTGCARVLMLALADMSNSDGFCWPSVKRLAQMCRCSERQVQRLIPQLLESGEIFADRGAGRGNTTRYLVTPQPEFSHLLGCFVTYFNYVPADAVKTATEQIERWEKWVKSAADATNGEEGKGDILDEKVTFLSIKGDTATSPDPLYDPSFDPDQERSANTINASPSVQEPVQKTQQPPKAPAPPAPQQAEPEMGQRSGFHDLLGQSRNSWFGMRSEQRNAMQRQQVARQAGFTLSGEVVDKLIEIHGLRAVVDAGDDRSLRRMQDMAIVLGTEPLCVRTVEQVGALFDDWKAANRGKVLPYGNVFAEYASRLQAEGRLKDGRVIGKPPVTRDGKGRTGRSGRKRYDDGIDYNAASAASTAAAALLPVPDGDIDF